MRALLLFCLFVGHNHAGTIQTSADDYLKYFGQKPPGAVPEKFAPHFITTKNEHEFGSVFSKNADEFYYGVDLGHRTEIRTTTLDAGVWSQPKPLISHSAYSFNDPFLSEDGTKLFFISNMPLSGRGAPKDYDIWYAVREADGWSEPINAGSTINSNKNEYFISATVDGVYYFSSNRNVDSGFDIYSSQLVD